IQCVVGASTIRRSTLCFLGEPVIERTQLDHGSLMSSVADLFDLVARRNLEFDVPAFDPGYLGFGADFVTDRRSRKVPYVDGAADRALAWLQERTDRIERGIFHDQDHYGRRKHLRQHCVLELTCKMFRAHSEVESSPGSQGDFTH